MFFVGRAVHTSVCSPGIGQSKGVTLTGLPDLARRRASIRCHRGATLSLLARQRERFGV